MVTRVIQILRLVETVQRPDISRIMKEIIVKLWLGWLGIVIGSDWSLDIFIWKNINKIEDTSDFESSNYLWYLI